MGNNGKNNSFSVLLDCNDDNIDKISERIEEALLRAKIDTWIYAMSIGEGCTIKFFAPWDIDFEFVVDIIKAELKNDYISTILETFEGVEIDKL